MTHNMLQAFARNGLQILRWCVLVVLYDKRAEKPMPQGDIHKQLGIPIVPKGYGPGGASDYALTREILRLLVKDRFVKYFKSEKYKITEEGIALIENSQ